jgi:uncharacterized membrane protein YqaE (UPF0057 family)
MAREGATDFVRVVLAYFVPPVGVFLQVGLGLAFWLNLLLTVFLFWLPGIVHALWVITSTGPGGRDNPAGTSDFMALVVGFFLPPVGVLMRKGFGLAFFLNLVLCLLFWIPGQLHAAWVVCSEDE